MIWGYKDSKRLADIRRAGAPAGSARRHRDGAARVPARCPALARAAQGLCSGRTPARFAPSSHFSDRAGFRYRRTEARGHYCSFKQHHGTAPAGQLLVHPDGETGTHAGAQAGPCLPERLFLKA